MEYRPAKAAYRDLVALAQSQGGYFTAKQAAELGYKYPHLDYHVGAGNFDRVGHGVYRLPEVPTSEHDDLVKLSFWSRGRDDRPQAVASNQTALAVHQLSDLIPAKIHLTVPRSFRKIPGKGIVLHRGEIPAIDVEERDGFFVTTPLRTLLDTAADPSIAHEHLKRAVRESLSRGIVRRKALVAALKSRPESNRLSRMIATMR
jgi:predicted transcriptional regulator of viral defense system